MRVLLIGALLCAACQAQERYDLLLVNGTVIDPKNHMNEVRDVAIRDGKIAAVASQIDRSLAHKVVPVDGLYVTPGIVDIHTHIFAGSGLTGAAGDFGSIWPDSHAQKSCVTTMVDAGTSGAKRFPEFQERIASKSITRIFAFLNIVGAGMAGIPEQDSHEMNVDAAVAMARRYPEMIVGFKTAHYTGPEWVAVDRALEAGKKTNLPIMVDFGKFQPSRPFEELVLKKLRPDDIYTHLYLYAVPMLDQDGKLREFLSDARQRGVKFDVGHGMGSFLFRQAVPAVTQGFMADSISSDIHYGNINGPMSDMLNIMSKFLNMGRPLEDVILRATWNPAQEIRKPELGHLSIGAPADIAVIRVDRGNFGFTDVWGARMAGNQRLGCEMTLRDGKFVYDINGRTREDWRKLPKNYGNQKDAATDRIIEKPEPGARPQKQ